VRDELADPFGVLDVGLAARDVVQMLGIEQPALKALLERLEDRLPVHAGGLHPDQRHRGLGEPVSKLRQPGERGAECSRLLIDTPSAAAGDADRRDHVVPVHIKPRAPLHHHIHRLLPPSGTS
jgi:hypothetical protein